MFDFMDMGYDEPGEPIASGPYIPDGGECMRCGVCVSSCPTFRLFKIDQETPRRRIRTISKILVENLPISAEERMHLDNCVQCRACETVCPSRMAYGQLFDQAQAGLKINPGWLAKLAFGLIERKRWRTRLMPLLAVYLKSGLQKPLRSTGLLKKLHLADAEALMAKPALQALAVSYPADGAKRGRVALFTGCIAEHFDRETLQAAIKLLNAIGYEVLVPPKQGCCGAIHQHNGQSAAGLMDNNIRVFNALDVDAVLHTATGCGAMLSEYQTDDEAGQLFRQRLYDISDFLLKHWPDDLQLTTSELKVVVHEPCSQRNVLKNQQAVYALLQKIPGLSIAPLPDNSICCGAGGSYMLTHPGNAVQLRALKQQAITAASADVVVSGNFGCAVFLSTNQGRVEHPLQLLARQLPVT
ncbi:MAG: (Fe-S)-binding protein [Methylobacter tundripaludum]|uniref:Glycolate oxidase iron-sulfur subunit n=1 Tax=Methylobacter tundripaludum TaxID=173365 RepID=A0A2S6GKJ8_9GAMM|nr:(Fe-S)-binding protein [Methylobacter tundripaludum]MCK9638231.1 (Fe-S)-binding protein [Methylobacter tundripaludum]PPK65713.1 glycolate oxidase iron-sulfur subunit [Methylobacter tundripaludum]